MERYLYFYQKFENYYIQTVMKAMNIVDPDPEWSNTARAARIVQFEKQLANITFTPVEMRDQKMIYSPTTLERLESKYSSFNWSAFLIGNFHHVDLDLKLSPTEKIVLSHQRYFDDLFTLLMTTPDDTVVDFIVWSFVMSFRMAMPPALRSILLSYRTQYLGVDRAQWSRQLTCVGITASTMPRAVSRLYITSNFSPATISATEEMINGILKSLIVVLKTLEWMTPETRERAIDKVRKMKADVGFSSEEISDNFLNNYYQGLVLSNNTFLENFITLSKFLSKKSWSQLRKPATVKWISPASDVNAFYLPTKNRIFLPAGVLQSPMFSLVSTQSNAHTTVRFLIQ